MAQYRYSLSIGGIFFFYLLPLMAIGEEQEGSFVHENILENEYPISKDYSRGRYLIYDCQGKFFACVNKRSFDLCDEKRNKNIDELLFILSCAPLRKFKDLQICYSEQIKQINRPQVQFFCFNPKIVRP